LGEHLLCTQGVAGSSPAVSTIFEVLWLDVFVGGLRVKIEQPIAGSVSRRLERADPDRLLAAWDQARRSRALLLDAGQSERGSHRLDVARTCLRLFAYQYRIFGSDGGFVPAPREDGEVVVVRAERVDRLPGALLVPEDSPPVTLEDVRNAPAAFQSSGEALTRGSLVHIGMAHHYARLAAKQPPVSATRTLPAQDGGVDLRWSAMGASGRHDYFVSRVKDPDVFLAPGTAMLAAAGKMLLAGDPFVLSTLPDALRAVKHAVDAMRVIDAADRILGVEAPIAVEVSGRRITSRIDLIRRRGAAGEVRIEDHKAAMRPEDRATLQRYQLSLQRAVLHLFGRHALTVEYGGGFAGVFYNIIGVGDAVGTVLPLSDPGPAPAFLAHAKDAILDTERAIATWSTSGRSPWVWPMASSSVCATRAYGRRCEAFELCAIGRAALRSQT